MTLPLLLRSLLLNYRVNRLFLSKLETYLPTMLTGALLRSTRPFPPSTESTAFRWKALGRANSLSVRVYHLGQLRRLDEVTVKHRMAILRDTCQTTARLAHEDLLDLNAQLTFYLRTVPGH